MGKRSRKRPPWRREGLDTRLGHRTTPGRSPTSRSPIAWFVLTFLLLVALFALSTSTGPAQRLVHTPASLLIVSASASFLSLFGRVTASGTFLSFNGFGVSIVEGCNGVLPTYIYLAAVLAFPSRWPHKAQGILLGIPAIFLINLTRVISLVICGAYWPCLFEQVHIYVWQALVIGLSMAVWVFWVERFVRRGSAAGS